MNWAHEVREVVGVGDLCKFARTGELNDVLAVPGLCATMSSNMRRDCYRSVDSGQTEVYKALVVSRGGGVSGMAHS